MKKIILVLIAIVASFLVLSELRTQPDPGCFIYKKETVSSWIPFLNKYYLYDGNSHRFKVDRRVYDSYWLWSQNEGIYATDELAGRFSKLVESELKKESVTTPDMANQIKEAQEVFVKAFNNSKYAKKYLLFFRYLKEAKNCDARCYTSYTAEDWNNLTEELK